MKEIEISTFELYVISDNPVFKDVFEQSKQIDFVVRLSTLDEAVTCKAIFVDGDSLPVAELKELRLLYPTQAILYRQTNVQNMHIQRNIQATCAAHEVTVLPENLTPEQMKEEVEKHLFQSGIERSHRVASFFGTHSGAGVSTTLMNVADLLAKRIEGKVLVLSLNPWDASDYFNTYEGRYLNDLKIALKTKSLSDEKFLSSLHHYPDSFYHLAGNRDIKLQRFFKVEEIEYLLELARDLFDIILVDGGPHFDNACYAQAYRGSDLRFLVTTQEPKGYLGYWPHIFEQLLQPLGATSSDFLLVLNRYVPENALPTEKDVSENLNIPLLATIPDEGSLGSNAITQKKLLHENGASKEYVDTLLSINRAIINQFNLKEKPGFELPNDTKGFFSRFRK